MSMASPKWVAYHSDLSGRMEIYVEGFPGVGNRQLISTSGGRAPLWNSDGSELFYRSIDGRQVLAVPITMEPTLTAGIARVLFEGPYVSSQANVRPYHLTPMGVFPLLKSLLPVVVAFLLPTTDTLDHRRVGNGTHRHGLFQEPMEELPAMA